VTGGNRSNILGTLGVLGNANLFLINPQGIAFGPNAQLDLRGSFIGSSADSVRFNNFEFSASNPQAPPLLAVNIPIGLRFQGNPGDIINQANGLQADPGQTLALLGGDIRFPGGVINSPGTHVELASVGRESTIDLEFTENNPLGLSFPSVTDWGAIEFSDRALILVPSTDEQAGGNITIRANSLQMLRGAQLISETGGLQAAGRIVIETTGPAILDGVGADRAPSAIFNTVNQDASGNAGGILIRAGSLAVTHGARLTADTSGQGNAGDITIAVPHGSVTFDDLSPSGTPRYDCRDCSAVFSNVNEGASGKGGNIAIVAGSLIIGNQARIGASTSGTGDAGSIAIQTNSLTVTNGGSIITSTFAQGDAGNITIDATVGPVIFDGTFDGVDANGELLTLRSGASSNADSTAGSAGNITIQASSLIVANGSQLSSYTSGIGNGGKIEINVTGPVTFEGVGRTDPNGYIHAISTSTGSGAIGFDNTQAAGHAGNITIRAYSIAIRKGAVISSDTFSQANGNAGNILLEALNGSVIFDGVGPLGNPSAAFSDVNTGAIGHAGSITINAHSLLVTNGAQLSSSTLGQGDAGSITIHARENVTFDGIRNLDDPEEFSAGTAVKAGASGAGGDLNIRTDHLEMRHGARLSVNSAGEGTAGNVNIQANSAQLDQQASITGNTVAGQGNLNLNIRNLILRRASNITTDARGDVAGGNINLTGEFLIAFPDENSNITANAQGGPGGRIEINVDNIFGIAPLTFTELTAQLPPGVPADPRLLPSSDITAISEAGAELSGQVIFNTSGVNPAQGLVELPQNIVDPNALIAANPCIEGKKSEFVVTGRGGIPPNPSDFLSQERPEVDWLPPLPSHPPNLESHPRSLPDRSDRPSPQPAQGWVINDRDQVTLVAYRPDPTLPQRLPTTPAACPAR